MAATGRPQANKQLVLDFLREVIVSRDSGAARKLVTDDYRQYAPGIARGPGAVAEYMRQVAQEQGHDPAAAGLPAPVFTVAEGDLVTACLYLPQPEPADPGETYDYFSFTTCRIRDGKIAECWPNTHKYVPLHRSPGSAADGDRATHPGDVGVTDLEANKQLVRDFYVRVFGTLDPGAVGDYVAHDYHQHAAHMPQGRSGLEEFVARIAASAPRAAAAPPEPAVLVAEGDIVVIAACLPQPETGGSGASWPYYAYDAYRVKDGKLAEHWSGINKAAPPRHG